VTGVDHATPGMIVTILGITFPVIVLIKRARRFPDKIYIRRIAGIDAIDEAVGGAVERGRPISFSTGMTEVDPVLYACLGVLYYIAKKVARLKTPLLIPQRTPDGMAIVEDVVRDAYRSEGRLSSYDQHNIRFFSEDQFAYASGYMGMIHREKVGSAFLFGSFAAESLILAEAGQQIGAMQVAASATPEQVAFFICTCDYTLIGEELFAASAYLSREAVQVGSLAGQDRGKFLILIFIIVGVTIATFKSIFPQYNIPNVDQLLTSYLF
jgi:hypothetical protein